MDKKYFAIRLIPPRSDFAQTMTDDEKEVMGQHVIYWTEKMNEGKAIAFGPVMDPAGVYGLGIIGLDDEKEISGFIAHDPAGQINRIEYFPMMATVRPSEGL